LACEVAPPPLRVPPLPPLSALRLVLSPHAVSARPKVRAATAGRVIRRREVGFTLLLLGLVVWDTFDAREPRWTAMAALVNRG
jgi:hypothetical protein